MERVCNSTYAHCHVWVSRCADIVAIKSFTYDFEMHISKFWSVGWIWGYHTLLKRSWKVEATSVWNNWPILLRCSRWKVADYIFCCGQLSAGCWRSISEKTSTFSLQHLLFGQNFSRLPTKNISIRVEQDKSKNTKIIQLCTWWVQFTVPSTLQCRVYYLYRFMRRAIALCNVFMFQLVLCYFGWCCYDYDDFNKSHTK